MATGRPSTPAASAPPPLSPQTPEQVRQLEIGRIKAKALRDQDSGLNQPSNTVAGQKRPYSSTVRDGRAGPGRPLDGMRPARNFTKYVEYDFNKMTDTKGGFLTQEDDHLNKAMYDWSSAKPGDRKPDHMSQAEWERQQLLKRLRDNKAGPFEPGISLGATVAAHHGRGQSSGCRECGTLEVDWKWAEVFKLQVCKSCKDKYPDKYSLLTKSEVREDYLLTEPELKDEALLPHIEKPNPHKSTWATMFLYLRCQVEEYAFSGRRWGSAEALDAEFERRSQDKKKRKEAKFKSKLADLKKRTRVQAYQKSRQGGGGSFGDDLGGGDSQHEHHFGRPVHQADNGVPVKTCLTCGLEVEELEL